MRLRNVAYDTGTPSGAPGPQFDAVAVAHSWLPSAANTGPA